MAKIDIKQKYEVEGLVFDSYAEAENHKITIELFNFINGLLKGGQCVNEVDIIKLLIQHREDAIHILQGKGLPSKEDSVKKVMAEFTEAIKKAAIMPENHQPIMPPLPPYNPPQFIASPPYLNDDWGDMGQWAHYHG